MRTGSREGILGALPRCNWEFERLSAVEDAIRLLSGYSMARIFNAVIICEGVIKHMAAF